MPRKGHKAESGEFSEMIQSGFKLVQKRQNMTGEQVRRDVAKYLGLAEKTIETRQYNGTLPQSDEEAEIWARFFKDKGGAKIDWAIAFLRAADHTDLKSALEKLYPNVSADRYYSVTKEI